MTFDGMHGEMSRSVRAAQNSRIVALVSRQRIPSGQGVEHQRSALVIAGPSFVEKHDHGRPLLSQMEFQAAFGAFDNVGAQPLFEQADRCAVRLEMGQLIRMRPWRPAPRTSC